MNAISQSEVIPLATPERRALIELVKAYKAIRPAAKESAAAMGSSERASLYAAFQATLDRYNRAWATARALVEEE